MSLFSNFVDRNTKDLQKGAQQIIDQTRNVIDQNTDTLTNPPPLFGGPINLSGTNGGGKGAPSYSAPPININIPTPNLDQDLAAPVVEAIQDINVPRPNTDQDLTKISVRGLQESAVEQGTQLQQEAINTGTKIQETVVQAGSNLQEAAVQAGASISGGQSNPTLENAAEQVTTYVEDKVVPFVRDLYAIAYGDKGPITWYQEAVHDFERNTPGIEALGNLDASLNSSDDGYSSSTTQLSADTPNLGDDQVFSDLETATGRGSQMSEEERLRRIRRLLTNRYGREKTILGGAGDTTSRRRYAV